MSSEASNPLALYSITSYGQNTDTDGQEAPVLDNNVSTVALESLDNSAYAMAHIAPQTPNQQQPRTTTAQNRFLANAQYVSDARSYSAPNLLPTTSVNPAFQDHQYSHLNFPHAERGAFPSPNLSQSSTPFNRESRLSSQPYNSSDTAYVDTMRPQLPNDVEERYVELLNALPDFQEDVFAPQTPTVMQDNVLGHRRTLITREFSDAQAGKALRTLEEAINALNQDGNYQSYHKPEKRIGYLVRELNVLIPCLDDKMSFIAYAEKMRSVSRHIVKYVQPSDISKIKKLRRKKLSSDVIMKKFGEQLIQAKAVFPTSFDTPSRNNSAFTSPRTSIGSITSPLASHVVSASSLQQIHRDRSESHANLPLPVLPVRRLNPEDLHDNSIA